MKKHKDGLTELEGAALSELSRRGRSTAYQLRREFLSSPSTEWSGSAGAIYPALRRLHAAGLLSQKATEDRRGTVLYQLTTAGKRALEAWLCDVNRAAGPGMDPFRSRAALWEALPPPRRHAFLGELARALEARCAAIRREMKTVDETNRRTIGLELELHTLRLRWLRREHG